MWICGYVVRSGWLQWARVAGIANLGYGRVEQVAAGDLTAVAGSAGAAGGVLPTY